MTSAVVKRSVEVAGRKTSVSLEDVFWTSLKEIADEREIKLNHLVEEIAAARLHSNLSSALRTHVVEHYKQKLVSGHGSVTAQYRDNQRIEVSAR